ncbi:hypothetical protein Val02_62620 [Virgisporangium aliadipatigenens]|uniref:Glutamine amidotransferase n=1 Tax=Virgisporangium aliadipatigenens TaxID=741659 RepID=A0A8J4DTJ9_9ACTN|nr:hypothetical protein [Virgisporangium aliadipatigenens]GIJ49376.1 hypothetical protein Val02_62620 [Virgisporangium aliadipatigenens]
MCLLTFYPDGVLPDIAALHNGAAGNPDGHGFAIVADNELIVQRGMDAEDMILAFDDARRRHPDGPALFHSRYTTHGRTAVDNCHPFPVAGDGRTVLAHNGVLPANVQPGKGDLRSDTRIAAEDYLQGFGSLRLRRTRQRLEKWMTPHNKMVILTVDRRFKDNAYILNEDAGIWNGGIWYSNDGYLLDDWAHYYGWDDERLLIGDGRAECVHCRTQVDTLARDCWCCGMCFDCDNPDGTCQCFNPTLPMRPLSMRT